MLKNIIHREYEYLLNNNKIMDMNVDFELEMMILCRENFDCFSFMNSI